MKVGKRVGRKEDEGRGRKEKEGKKRKASESMHALTRTCIHSYFLHRYIHKFVMFAWCNMHTSIDL